MTQTFNDQPSLLHVAGEDFPLQEYRLRAAGREWNVLHAGAMLTLADESRFFRELRGTLPYGVALWPAAVALAHEVATRAAMVSSSRVLELGAGTGLPGIIAASFGAQVVQSDRDALALSMCQRNGARNGVDSITYRLADWHTWDDTTRYDLILGADILYGESLHNDLRRIFETNLAPGGRILLSDPFRAVSLSLLEAMEAAGWTVLLSTWNIGEDEALRSFGLFELTPPE